MKDTEIFDYLVVADKVVLGEPDALANIRLYVISESQDLHTFADIEYKALVQADNSKDLIITCAIKLDDFLLSKVLDNATSEIFLH